MHASQPVNAMDDLACQSTRWAISPAILVSISLSKPPKTVIVNFFSRERFGDDYQFTIKPADSEQTGSFPIQTGILARSLRSLSITIKPADSHPLTSLSPPPPVRGGGDSEA